MKPQSFEIRANMGSKIGQKRAKMGSSRHLEHKLKKNRVLIRVVDDLGAILGGLLGAFSVHNFFNIEKIHVFEGFQNKMQMKTVFGPVFGRFLQHF